MTLGSESYQNYKNWASENDIGIIGQIQNSAIISSTFTTYEQRNTIIDSIYNQVMDKGYFGIYIDFDQIDDINCFYRFIIELSPKFKSSGLKVIVKLKSQMDQSKVESIVDCVVE